MKNFYENLSDFIKNLDNESVFEGDNLEKMKAEHEALQKRFDENLQRKDPLSFLNVARLCYGNKKVEQILAKNNK